MRGEGGGGRGGGRGVENKRVGGRVWRMKEAHQEVGGQKSIAVTYAPSMNVRMQMDSE